jgi:hypothetical protein
MTTDNAEIQLKKRLDPKFSWGKRRVAIWDDLTHFVLQYELFDEVIESLAMEFATHSKFEEIRNYALNRWYNFYAQKTIESIFFKHPMVRKVTRDQSEDIDIYVQGNNFRTEIVELPESYKPEFEQSLEGRKKLIKGLYNGNIISSNNQNLNHLFVVVSGRSGESWKLKSDVIWLKELIYNYLNKFDALKLIEFEFRGSVVKSDVIFGLK